MSKGYARSLRRNCRFVNSVTLYPGKEPRLVIEAKVIVIEPTESEAASLLTLLRFLDLDPIHVRDLAELRRSASALSQECLAVIVGEHVVSASGQDLIAALRTMRQPLPVIYLSSEGLPKIAEA